ncbi:hypothetical protein EDB81DRAFT_902015 [Dactylonectria macrodidyma]|uniref:Rhodopsin domain-containing protein n=1 Tax=Dactylonectria macrodidyma TaxID=307937 RepID=A0A9P9EGR4_9HYPO|nr:hypothetical protein EDB81DRAFT_902015 [Dactylonectria macrodidyma]
MAMGGDGPAAVAVLWALTFVVLVFVILRIYARATVVHTFGPDDYVYVVSFIFLLFFAIFITLAAMYGFGRDISDIPDAWKMAKAVLYECIGQTFNVIGMTLAKWSLGFFLLRIVQEPWHKTAIWASMLLLMGASISCMFCFWLQCSPIAFLWDWTIPGGKCELNTLPIYIILGTFSVLVDFFFAIFPWIFMWKLQMNQREKLIILGSMSLGIILCTRLKLTGDSAGGFGIKRATEIPRLSIDNYLIMRIPLDAENSVGIIVWGAAEMAVTMVCIGIPICRPLYKRYLGTKSSKDDSKYKGNSGAGYRLKSFEPSKSHHENRTHSGDPSITDEERGIVVGKSMGLKNPYTTTYAIGGTFPGDNQSEEEILGPDFQASQQRRSDDAGLDKGILVTEEYQVRSC